LLVVPHSGLRFGFEKTVDAEERQRKPRIDQGLLKLSDCRPFSSKLQETFIVETSLEHQVSGETR